jgi:hypothetical protein
MADLLHHWSGSAFACCASCRGFSWHCPSCGTFQGRRLPDDGISFPTTGTCECIECGVIGTLTLLGWKPAAALQQAFDLPAAQRPQPPAKSRARQSRTTPQDGNSNQKRLTLREWMNADPTIRRRVRAVNNAPRIREAHVRNGCAPTYRSGFWIYTRAELQAALDLIEQRQRGGRRHG